MTYFLEIGMEEAIEGCRSVEEGKLVKWGVKIALSTLGSGGAFVDLADLR